MTTLSTTATRSEKEPLWSEAVSLRDLHDEIVATMDAETDYPTLCNGTTRSFVPCAMLGAARMCLVRNPHLCSEDREKYLDLYARTVTHCLGAREYYRGLQMVGEGFEQMIQSDPDSVQVVVSSRVQSCGSDYTNDWLQVRRSDGERRPVSLEEVQREKSYYTELLDDFTSALEFLEWADPDRFSGLAHRRRLKSKL